MVGPDGVRERDARLGEAIELLALLALPGVGPRTAHALISRFGGAGRAWTAPAQAFGALAGEAAARARTDRTLLAGVARRVEQAHDRGVEVRTWTSPEYPPALRQLADPPPVLFLRGREELLRAPAVTIVGARRSTERAHDVARRLARALVARGVTVVSGLALGVDGAAHRGALEPAGRGSPRAVPGRGGTVAVLGTGIDVPYPASHRRLYADVAERGLLVSEFVPGTPAAPHHFPRRNRILAALAETVVVVEAGVRSGSLITVDHALDLGRDVWAVPGPIDLSVCDGSNRLLADGARALVSIDEFVESVAPAVAAHGVAEDGVAEGGASPGAADPIERRALDALSGGPATIDDVAVRLAVPVGTALAALTTLELHGEVERLPGMRFRRAA